MAQRIQRRRSKGWQMPPNSVYVGRPTIWGNPFIHSHDVSQAVAAYRMLATSGGQFTIGPDALQIAKNCHPNTLHWAYPDFIREHIYQLRGRNLACWCPVGEPCHADVLLEMATA